MPLFDSKSQTELSLGPEELRKYEGHFELLRSWNERMSLVSPKSIETALGTHYVDSIRIADFGMPFAEGREVIDLGAGAGFPGLIVAIRFPNRAIILYEKSLKKQTFLVAAVTQLRLPNVTIEGALTPRKRKVLAFARAVMPPVELFPFLKRNLSEGSCVVFNTGGSAPAVELPTYFAREKAGEYELPQGCGKRRVEVLRLERKK